MCVRDAVVVMHGLLIKTKQYDIIQLIAEAKFLFPPVIQYQSEVFIIRLLQKSTSKNQIIPAYRGVSINAANYIKINKSFILNSWLLNLNLPNTFVIYFQFYNIL